MKVDDNIYLDGFTINSKDLESSSPFNGSQDSELDFESLNALQQSTKKNTIQYEFHSSDFSSDDNLQEMYSLKKLDVVREIENTAVVEKVGNHQLKVRNHLQEKRVLSPRVEIRMASPTHLPIVKKDLPEMLLQQHHLSQPPSKPSTPTKPRFPISPPKNTIGNLSPISKMAPKSPKKNRNLMEEFKMIHKDIIKTEIPMKPEVEYSQHSSSYSSAPIPWSSSPDFHKTETLLTMGLNSLNQFNKKSPKKDKTNQVLAMAKDDICEVYDKASSPSPKRLIWNQPIAVTQQAKLERRKLNIQKRNMTTMVDDPVPIEPEWDEKYIEAELEAEREMLEECKAESERDTPFNPSHGVDQPVWESSNQNQDHNQESQEQVQLQLMPHKNKKKNNTFFLSHEQQKILEIVVNKKSNIFFTGAAGTGKSVLLERIIKDLKKKYSPEAVAVTASTGLAACHVGGITLHSFSGIGLGKDDANQLVKKVRKNRKAIERWNQIQCLVIDEISMIDGDLFDKLEHVARSVRRGKNKSLPFGGIQIVITGDFFQLPPVPDKDANGKVKDFKFCFEGETWNTVIDKTYLLKKVFRQKDNTFSTMLNEMRRGEMSDKTIETFKSLSRPLNVPLGLTPTELFPLRYQVDGSNSMRLKKLRGESFFYEADDNYNDANLKHVFNLDNLMAVSRLELKRQSQVMMIKNWDETLVNGTLGTVVDFWDHETYNSYMQSKEDEEFMEEYDDVFGIPEENDEIENDKNNVKWKRKLATLQLLNHKNKIQSLSSNQSPSPQLFPLVRFELMDGTIREVLVKPESWTLENQEGVTMAERKQIPLILAWALSIHKAQGQTLQYVKVDLRRTFEKGQAYVAISRAVKLEGLQIFGFAKEKVMVHDKVVQFYDSLNTIQEEESSLPLSSVNQTTKRKAKKQKTKQDFFYDPKQQILFENYKPKSLSEVIPASSTSSRQQQQSTTPN